MFLQNVYYAWRRICRTPGFSAVVVIIVALGVGANTAVFSLMYTVMLQSLPVSKPTQLYRVGNQPGCCVQSTVPDFPGNWGLFSYPLYKQFREQVKGVDGLAAFQAGIADLNIRDGAKESARHGLGEFVSGNYFSIFGVRAATGRLISPADDMAGAEPVVIISYRLWQQEYNRDRSILGKVFTINNVPMSVIGIAPSRFFGDTLRENPPDFWLPLSTEPSLRPQNTLLNQPHINWLCMMGRLSRTTTPSQVGAQATIVLQQWLSSQEGVSADERKQIARQTVRLIAGGHGIVARLQSEYAQSLVLLTWISVLALLISCANIASLCLARLRRLRGQLAVSVVLGASKSRLFTQMLTESVMLALLGGIAALAVAYVGARFLIAIAFRGAEYVPISPRPSVAVLAFTFAVALVAGVVFGVVPAWSASRLQPIETLRNVQRSTGAQSYVTQQSLVVTQTALSLILLVVSGMLSLALRNLESQRFGFQTADRWLVNFNPEIAGYTPERLGLLYSRIRERLGSIPGVKNVSISTYVPFSGYEWGNEVYVEGERLPGSSRDRGASWSRVTPRYFDTIGTLLIKGRTILDQDTPTSLHVAVVNEAFVTKFFGAGANALSRHFGVGTPKNSNAYEIVGVVADAKYLNTDRPAAMFFLPFGQLTPYSDPALSRVDVRSNYAHNIELYVSGRSQNLAPTVRRTIADIDPNVPVLEFHSFDEQIRRYFNHEHIIAQLTTVFALLALILACLGVYGVTAYAVARRTSEIGVRLVLGADRRQIITVILGGVFFQTVYGLVIGTAFAFAGAKGLGSKLFGVKSYDPAVFGIATGLLLACSILAALLPTLRAIKIDPAVAVRYE